VPLTGRPKPDENIKTVIITIYTTILSLPWYQKKIDHFGGKYLHLYQCEAYGGKRSQGAILGIYTNSNAKNNGMQIKGIQLLCLSTYAQALPNKRG
jgi:hypothetical protein